MASAKSSFTSAQFDALLPKLSQELTSELERELVACTLPASGLWDLPTVDSKTVCKLSPVVKKYLDRRLEPAWVRKGGYESVKAAVDDVIAHARKSCVTQKTKEPAKTM